VSLVNSAPFKNEPEEQGLSISTLNLGIAQKMIASALAHGRCLSLAPLSVAVLDAGGHLLAFARSDGSSSMRPQIAIAKASGALALGVSSRRIGEMAAERPLFVGALSGISQAGIVPAAGGVIVLNGEGWAVGAVGITGDTSDNDEACALRAVAAAGFKAKA
jgi:uncharacterized protein GlcG (DUF336 family)